MADYCYYLKIRGDSLERNVSVWHWGWSEHVEAHSCLFPHAGMFECCVTSDSKFEFPIGCNITGGAAAIATRRYGRSKWYRGNAYWSHIFLPLGLTTFSVGRLWRGWIARRLFERSFRKHSRMLNLLKTKSRVNTWNGSHMSNWSIWRFKLQWLLYVPQDLTYRNLVFCPRTAFLCFVLFSEQTAILSLYFSNW